MWKTGWDFEFLVGVGFVGVPPCCAGLRSHQTRRGVKMGIRKYSKTFENVQKLGGNIRKLTRNIRKYSKILQVLAHLIEILLRWHLRHKPRGLFISHGFCGLHGFFLDRITGFTGICLSQLGVLGKHYFQSKLCRRNLPLFTRPSKWPFY